MSFISSFHYRRERSPSRRDIMHDPEETPLRQRTSHLCVSRGEHGAHLAKDITEACVTLKLVWKQFPGY